MPIPESATPRRRFEGGVAIDDTTFEVAAAGVTGYLYATHSDAVADVNRLPVLDLNGSAIALQVGPQRVIPPFMADLSGLVAYVAFGSIIQQVVSVTALIADLTSLTGRVIYLEANGGGGGSGGGTTSPDVYPATNTYPVSNTY